MKLFLLAFFTLLSIWPSALCRRDANSRFKLCCARQSMADQTCKRRFCDFNSLSQDNILLFINLCSAKGNTVKDMWECASSKMDHTACCKRKNVPSECLKYCDYGKAPPPNDYLNHLLCLQTFDKVKGCFKEHLDQHANIYGDF
ncbi:DB module [Aphelenchoides bicaudatus]|nr:DB module [Aphelenchoides bicaudatus]